MYVFALNLDLFRCFLVERPGYIFGFEVSSDGESLFTLLILQLTRLLVLLYTSLRSHFA